MSEEDLRTISLSKRDKRIKKYGGEKILIIACCIKYIDRDENLRKILCANKQVSSTIKTLVYKQALLYC